MDPRATLIYLLRHGEIALAERRRFVGHLDVPLSPRGEAQCERQARRLGAAKLSAIFSSDLTRAVRSARIIGAPHGLTPKTLPALREMDMGRWEGLTAAELEAREPAAFRDWIARVGEYPFPEGEDVARLVARAWPAFEAIASEHSGQAVAVVAHAGPNRAILCRALGLPFTHLTAFGQDYAALTVLERTTTRWRLLRLNEGPGL
ncbi:MAG TPA: histidine phosphatase family protein [Candidatus Acidoferrum sp.]|nr:histidine phosphatase family protein [Candidatus Acidoferrum sp.]